MAKSWFINHDACHDNISATHFLVLGHSSETPATLEYDNK